MQVKFLPVITCPAATKQPKRKVTRQRLNFDEWKKIFEIADKQHRYVGMPCCLHLLQAND